VIRPNAWWYASCAIPLVACVVLGVVLLVGAIRTVAHGLTDFTTPSAVTVHLDERDQRDIFVHRPSGVSPSEADCRVTGPTGTVPLRLSTNTRIQDSSDRYRSLFTFEAPADGDYRVHCGAERPVDLAVGPHVGVRTLAGVIGAIAAFFVGLALAGGVVALVAILRHRSKVKLDRERLYGAAGWRG
jgi:preprotein translocase subunit SecF